MIDQELLKACVINPWSVVPRMMLADSMIESGWEEVKALEAFEPPTISIYFPTIYGGYGSRFGCGYGSGSGYGDGRSNGSGNGRGNNYGYGSGLIHVLANTSSNSVSVLDSR